MRLRLQAVFIFLLVAAALQAQPAAAPGAPPPAAPPYQQTGNPAQSGNQTPRRVGPPGKKQDPDQAQQKARGVHVHFGDDEDDDPLKGSGNKLVYQPIDAPPFGDHLDLRSIWLFHSGSAAPDQNFASAAFDDSHWTAVDTVRPLFTDMIFGVNEIWYRTHVHLAPGTRDLALSLAGIGGSYRLIVNGRSLGGHGLMSGPGEYLLVPSDTFLIPNDLLAPAPGQPPGAPPELTIVLHLFAGTINRITFGLETGISAKSIIFLGPTSTLLRDQHYFAQTSSAETGAILTVWAIVLILAIALAALVPQVRVYPVLAIYAGAHLLARVLANIADSNYLSHTHWVTWPQNLALVVTVIAALELCRLIAGSPRHVWLTLLEVLYALSIFAIYPAAWGLISYYFYSMAYQVVRFALIPAFVYFVIAGVARRRVDAIILAGTGLLYGFYALAWFLLSNRSLTNLLLDAYVRGFAQRVTPASMAELAFILGFLVVLIVHTLRIIRERSLIATEMQAARTMQQLLLARSSDPTPGFTVETAYLPAGDVGGDFFLVGIAKPESTESEANREQDLFAVVGDVSGKGLKAAMNVSMLLGVLRREPSRSPATVLCSLNEALLAPSAPILSSENAHLLADPGFTTACCVRLTPTGHYTIANAGHLSPYLVGPRFGVAHARELVTPPTLPLGLAPDQQYEVIEGSLAPGERLVLLSDGVPEARSAKGELYGFDRTLPLVLRSANEIAMTAFAFGQEDDITVLTLACRAPSTNQPPPPPVPAAPSVAAPPAAVAQAPATPSAPPPPPPAVA